MEQFVGKRDIRFDLLRVILVMFVVLGHGTYYTISTRFGGIYYEELMQLNRVSDTVFHTYTSLFTNWIYTFHMPAFVSLSGALFAIQIAKNRYPDWNGLIIDKVKRLIIPLLVVWLFWNMPVKYLARYYENIPIRDWFLQILYPDSVYLWYLEALFLDFLLTYFILRYMKSEKLRIAIVLFLWAVGVIISRTDDFRTFLGNPLKYILWFWVGLYINKIADYLRTKRLWNTPMVIFVLTCQVGIWVLSYLIGKGKWLINNTILPFIAIIVLYYIVEKSVTKLSEKTCDRIIRLSKLSYGIYLYAEPLNYLIIYLVVQIYGISVLGYETGALCIYLARIIGTPFAAILMIKTLRVTKLNFLT